MTTITKQLKNAYYVILSVSYESMTDVMNRLKWVIYLYDFYGSDITPAARRYCKMSVEHLYLSLADLVNLRGDYYTGCITDFIIILRHSKLGKLIYRDPDYRYIILGGKKGVDYNARD